MQDPLGTTRVELSEECEVGEEVVVVSREWTRDEWLRVDSIVSPFLPGPSREEHPLPKHQETLNLDLSTSGQRHRHRNTTRIIITGRTITLSAIHGAGGSIETATTRDEEAHYDYYAEE